MSWKQIKTLAILILSLMNAVFLFLILQRHYRATHYDDDLVNSAIAVFRESELYVDRSFLLGKMESLPVYTGMMDPEALDTLPIVHAIARAGYTVHDEPGGIRCENAVGEFYFGDDFGFFYSEKGKYERPSDLLATERYLLLQEDNAERARAIGVVDAFLEKYEFFSAKSEYYDYEIAYDKVYSSGISYIVTLSQRIGDISLHEQICVMVSGGRVVCADGIFATQTPQTKEKAQTVDLVNLLFEEKAYLDAIYRAGGSFSYTPMVLTGVSYSYAVYFDAAGRFYLVPLCEIAYANGEVRTYNCVSGKLYS